MFCASLADVGEDRPDLVAPRERLFALIRATPELDWLLLTKRIETLAGFLPWMNVNPYTHADIRRARIEARPWRNVWLGVTVEDQEYAAKRLPILLDTPAAVHFASYEPALGPIDFTRLVIDDDTGPVNALSHDFFNHPLDWIVAGDESGPGRRSAELAWFRAARDQADSHGVSFHLKQWCDGPADGIGGDAVKGKIHLPVLDGRQWAEFPEARS